MAIQNKNTLKSWFLRGSKPLAAQFADWMDSFWHKDENIPASKIENLQSLLDGKANSNVIEQIKNSVETLSAHPSDNIRHVTQQDKEYWNGKADVTVKGSWKTAALHAHYFASSAINKYAVGKYIPLIRLVSNNIGKMDCYFDIIAREFGEYQSYFGRFMFTGSNETAKLTCLDYFDNGLGKMLSADDICFKLEGNIATIYRKISNTPESPANTDYFIVSVWGENTSTYSSQNYYTTAGILEPNELQLLEAVDVTGATVAVLANDYGSVEMASSTADVLKEKTLYFIKNGNVYDGYKLGEYETSISNVYEETTDIGVGTDEYASLEIKCLDGVLFGYKKPYNTRSKLMKSYDLGATWEEIQVGLITKGIRFYILNGQIVVLGITADDTKKLYVSTDLGITWTEKTPPPSSFFDNPAVYYKGKYYTISNGNVLDSSSDLVTWESVTTEFTPNNWGLYTFKDLIIAISSSGYGYWSEDGETWTRFTFTNFSGGYCSYPSVSDGNIIIIKCPYAWLKSYDGKTWIETYAGSGGFNYLESAAYNGSVWLVRMANSGQVESRTLIGSNFDNLSIIENNFPYHNAASLIPIENSFIAAYSRTNNTYVYKIDLSKSPMKVVNGFDYDRYYTKSEIDEKIPTQEQIVGWNDHVQDGDIHVTTEEKELWNLVSDDSYHNIVPINFNTLRKTNVTPGVVYYYDYTTKKDRIYKFKNLLIPTTNAVILKLLDSNNNVLQSITSGLNSNEEISVVSNQDSQKISIETDYTNFAVTVTEYTNYKYLPMYMSVDGSYQLFTPAEGTTSIAYTFRKDRYYLIKNTSETARFNMQVNGVYLTYSIYPNTQIVCKMPVSGNSATLFTTGAGCELTIEEVLLPWEELKKFINQTQYTDPTKILYEKKFTDMSEMSEFDINQGTLTTNGYQLSSGQVLKLNKYYSLGYRTVKYLVKFGSSGGTATFKSNSGDTIISVDYTNGTFNLNGLSLVSIPNFDNSHQYLIAITKNYQDQIVSVTDVYTGATTSHTYTRNGTGGKGQGAVGTEIITGMQYDYYMITVTSGSDQILLKKIIVEAGKYDLFLTMYGDSITEPEGYYPTVDFSKAWTQLFVANCAGKAICSGRGGTTINQIMTRISNELPFIRSKYVMITIGTNGGNTYENLCELVEYIQSLGSTAIINHIPCNESGTQVAVNAVIDQVRARYGIKGVDFDKATSLAEDGVTVDTDKMWWENISESQNIYHHPNVLGSAAMYARARIDCPELFNS